MLVILILFMPLEGGYRNLLSTRIPLHLVRGLCVVVANMSFFFGLGITFYRAMRSIRPF